MPLLLSLLIVAAATPGVAPRPRVKVAVLDVQDITGRSAARAKLLTDVAVSEVAALRRFDVISSFEIGQLLGLEQQKALLGCTHSESCLAEIAGALGVDYLVSGRLGRLGSRERLDLRLVDARKARLVASEGEFVPDNGDAVAEAMTRLVRQLFVDSGLTGTVPLASPHRPAAGAVSPRALDAVAPAPSRTPAFLMLGTAVALALGATVMTVVTKNAFDNPASSSSTVLTDARVADGLVAGTLLATGLGAWFWFRAPSGAGSGGEIGIGGSF